MVGALNDAGVSTLLATTDADGSSRLPVRTGAEVDYGGAPVIFFSRLPGESLKPSPAMARWLRHRAADYDLLHIHSVFSHPSLAAGSSARAAAVPYVVRPLGQLDEWSLAQHPIRKRVFLAGGGRRLLERAAAFHWTDESERERSHACASMRPGFAVPLGVDEQLFTGGSATARRPVILFLSRLHRKKNVEGLVSAFLVAGPTADGWKLVVAGEGDEEYERALRDLVARLGGEARVEFVGWLEGEAKHRALRESALLALPSRQENFGIVVAEAMAAGMPVLISEAVALAGDVERSGAGWVFPVEGAGLEKALEAAMGSEEERRRRGDAARWFAEKRFRWGAIADALVMEYERILHRPAGSS
jgi:glycosyltransferase involved in cell wall biosynthesis